MFTETSIVVSAEPKVDLFTLRTDGPADRVLLVIHGGPDWDHTYLRDPLLRLAGRHRVLLPDLRGCGRSTRDLPDSEYTWDAVVHDLLALLDAEDVATADLLGFSTGGLIAQRLVLAAPNRFRRLEIQSSGEWSRVWEAGLLGSPRPDRGPERLAALGLPTLLLQGRYDMTFPAALAEDTAARDPAARAVVLDEAGHMAHLDQPEAWLAALTEFLA